MATYKCRKCGNHKNDTPNSQLDTRTTCTALEKNTKVVLHDWEMVSEEDLDRD